MFRSSITQSHRVTIKRIELHIKKSDEYVGGDEKIHDIVYRFSINYNI